MYQCILLKFWPREYSLTANVYTIVISCLAVTMLTAAYQYYSIKILRGYHIFAV
jgi:hypothetical protein